MREDIAGVGSESSRPTWEELEGWVRERTQEFIQGILEEEVTELLGREKSERRRAVDAVAGYRNGYGKPRRLAMSSGTITVRRPRVRGLEERFESGVLPLFARRTKEVLALRSGYRESVEPWSEVLRDLKARGIEAPRLLMADGNAAIWGAVRQVWPEAGEQRCWNHKMRNVLDRLPQREQSEAKDLLRAVVYAPSRAEAVKAREVFARRYRPWYPKAVGRTRGRLGADGGVLRLPRGSLEASTHDETWSRARSLRYGSGRQRRSDSSGSRALRR